MKPNDFGQKLISLRNERDLKQIEVVRFVNKKYGAKITPSSYSKWERGKELPSRVVDVVALAQFYEVNLDWLIGLSDKKYNEDEKENFYRVPILRSFTPGVSIFTQTDILGYEIINGENLEKRIDFCYKVKDDSMSGACIFEGDIVFVHAQPHIESGEIAVVVFDNRTSLKRIYWAGKTIILHSENIHCEDIVLSGRKAKELFIAGKVLYIKGRVK